MKKEVNPIVIVVAVVIVVAGVVGGMVYFANPHTPYGVHYTPGVPPWMEKGAKNYKPTPDYPAANAQQAPASPAQPPFAPPQTISGNGR